MNERLQRSAAWFLVTWEWVFLFAGILALRVEVADAVVGDARQVPLVLGLASGILAMLVMGVALKLGGKSVRLLSLVGIAPFAWIAVEFWRRAEETFG